MPQHDVIIIGAGVSGLTAAVHLQNEGLDVKILEASNRSGGRVKTDIVDGFILDHGFQVLQTSYPETRRMIDFDALGLKNFYPGALIRYNDKFHRFADPFRKPSGAFGTLFNPLSNVGDKFKILALKNRFSRFELKEIFNRPEKSTIDYLHDWNFSDSMIRSFFRPFLGGIFLDKELETSSRMFRFAFKMFSEGFAALPADGIQAIPQQLELRLKRDTISFNTKVEKISRKTAILENGEKLTARSFLIATDAPAAQKLAPKTKVHTKGKSVTCVYFATAKPPVIGPILVLNGEPYGWVNNLCVPSVVHPHYAPHGRHLVSVSILEDVSHLTDEKLEYELKQELSKWYNQEVLYWKMLKVYRIPYALPSKETIELPKRNEIQQVKSGVYMCGDHNYYGSINGVMENARIMAEAISWDLALSK